MIFVNNTRMSLKQLAVTWQYELMGAVTAVPVGISTYTYVDVLNAIILAILTGGAGAFGGFLVKSLIKYSINKYKQWQKKI